MVDIVTLPTSPSPNKAIPRPVATGTDLQGPIGTATQRILRLGSCEAVDYEFPPMRGPVAAQWAARLRRAEASPVAIAYPMRGFDRSNPGPLVVNGSVVGGNALPLRGGLPLFYLAEGRPFHLLSGGRRYIHFVEQAAEVAPDGGGVIYVTPLLRVQAADGDVLEFVSPMIEGFVALGQRSYDISAAIVSGLKFTVTEDR